MKLKGYHKNPILKPIRENFWESKAVFNPAAIYHKGKVHLLYRAIGEYENYISRLGYATSEDGFNFKRKKSPVFETKEEFEGLQGCEDPRITKIGNTIYITWVIVPMSPKTKKRTSMTFLATTKDFKKFKKYKIITPPESDNRDTVLFPEKIGGKYVMLHRPLNWIKENIRRHKKKLYLKSGEDIIEWPLQEIPDYFPQRPSIWIAFSRNLKDWHGHKVVMEPKRIWEDVKIGAGPPPIRTKKGWFLIYHGVEQGVKYRLKRHDKRIQDRIYRAGFALLDLKNPSKVILRSRKPILKPKRIYEIKGDVPHVVFPSGIAIIDDKLFIYYGAADKTCCVATCDLLRLGII